jgi:adenylate cyclase 10
VENKVATISKEIMQILENEETILIDPPRCRLKVNGPLIDRLSCLE